MPDERRRYIDNIPAARSLRQRQTPSESLLGERLRSRRFQGLKFRCQHAVFAYVLDFYCPELRLAIEIDGGIHHTPQQRERDRERQLAIEELGISFLRVSADDVEDDLDGVLERKLLPFVVAERERSSRTWD